MAEKSHGSQHGFKVLPLPSIAKCELPWVKSYDWAMHAVGQLAVVCQSLSLGALSVLGS